MVNLVSAKELLLQYELVGLVLNRNIRVTKAPEYKG